MTHALCLDIKNGAMQGSGMDQEPLHRKIAGDIERRIASAEWKPGFRIPTEAALMAQYGCARMTVSRAITELAARSLVVRRRKAGTVVAHPPVHSSALLSIPDIQSEVQSRGQAYSHRLLSRSEKEADLSDGMGARVLRLETLHLSDSAPFVFETRLISLDTVPQAEDEDFTVCAPGKWLVDNMPWTEAEHRISAVAADRNTANHLGLADGTACLKLERQTWRDGQGVTRATQIFPGSAYDLVARFSPTKG